MTSSPSDTKLLSEQLVQDGFHSYLKSSLAQAKLEKLLDADLLSSAESDLMITGPALCLYFAALRCRTVPPSVPLPRTVQANTSQHDSPLNLSDENCPPSFVPFLRVWANSVPRIQSLQPEHQHDLARIICNLSPLSESPPPEMNGIAAELHAVAIEISQRRSFQDRYAAALQAALDAGTPSSKRATFTPPPLYEGTSSTNDTSSDVPPPLPVRPPRASSPPADVPAPSGSPAMTFIRETLYAALLDVITSTPSLIPLFKTDPPMAYFSSTSLAILQVATTCIIDLQNHGLFSDDHDDFNNWAIRGIGGRIFTIPECPHELQPFMQELISIARDAKRIEGEDTRDAIRCVQSGEEVHTPRLERARGILEDGISGVLNSGNDSSYTRAHPGRLHRRLTSVEGRALSFANRVNGLSLGMTKLKSFEDRQGDVFQALTGIS